MSVKRKFISIQAIESEGSIALIALGDDGTAWTARTHANSGYMESDGLEWKPITALPKIPMTGFFGDGSN